MSSLSESRKRYGCDCGPAPRAVPDYLYVSLSNLPLVGQYPFGRAGIGGLSAGRITTDANLNGVIAKVRTCPTPALPTILLARTGAALVPRGGLNA